MNLKKLEACLGYKFRTTNHIEAALTHSSAIAQLSGEDYERLEFLGDRIVNLVIADLLFKIFTNENEGALAKRHAAFVRTETLAEASRSLQLGEFVILSDAERIAGGDENDNILADIMEAVTAAIYLDGGFDHAEKFIEMALGDKLHNMAEPPRDPKTALQEWSQAREFGLPHYELISQSGPDHAPEFTVQVSIDGYNPQTATSTSKKKAEKDAAKIMLDIVQD